RLQLGAHHPHRQPATARQEHQVARQEIERPDVQPLADRDRARGDHHHAHAGERDGRAHQPRVEAAFDGVESCRLARGVGHQRTFNVAKPTSTRITEMIQKRTITRGSGQPLSSKWWWMGAMRNTRLPVSLNEATWIITDSVSITNTPPITTSTSSW